MNVVIHLGLNVIFEPSHLPLFIISPNLPPVSVTDNGSSFLCLHKRVLPEHMLSSFHRSFIIKGGYRRSAADRQFLSHIDTY